MHTDLLNQVSLLSIDAQIDLVEGIWDGIASRSSATQKAELASRLARIFHEAPPKRGLTIEKRH